MPPTILAQPIDRNKFPIPCLSFRRGGGAHKIAFTASSARNSVAFDSPVVSIFSTQDCYIEIGNSAVVATTTTHFIPKGVWLDVDLSDGTSVGTHIAAIRDTADGTLYVSERA